MAISSLVFARSVVRLLRSGPDLRIPKLPQTQDLLGSCPVRASFLGLISVPKPIPPTHVLKPKPTKPYDNRNIRVLGVFELS